MVNTYKAESVIGRVGSIISVVSFTFMVLFSTMFGIIGAKYGGRGTLVAIVFAIIIAIANMILGFIGTSKLQNDKKSGGILLLIAAGLSLIACIIGFTVAGGYMQIPVLALFLPAGIMAVIKKPAAVIYEPAAAPDQPTEQPIHQKPAKPYKTEVVLGLIGSIIGYVMYLIIFIVTLSYAYAFSFNILSASSFLLSSLFSLASFILGFIGIALLSCAKPVGGKLLTVGGSLGLLAVFVGLYIGWITIFSFPLLLAAGIVALARRNSIERNKLTADQVQLPQ